MRIRGQCRSRIALPAVGGVGRTVLSGGAAVSSARLAGLAASLVATPVLVRHLGPIEYGVYETIVSGFAWLSLAQLGVGPSLLNRVAASRSSGDTTDRLRSIAAAGIGIQLAMGALLATAAIVVLPRVDWARLMGAPPQLAGGARGAVTVAIVVLALGLPASLSRPLLLAFGRPKLAALWDVAGAATRLVAIVAIALAGGGLAAVTGASLGATVLVSMLALVVLLRALRPWRRPSSGQLWSDARGLAREARHFVAIAVASTVILSTDNLVIARLVGPAAVTGYAVAWKLGSVAVLAVIGLLDVVWPAYTAAAERGDTAWLRRTYRRTTRAVMAGMVLWSIGLAVFGLPVLRLWVGAEALPSRGVLLVVSLLIAIQGSLLSAGRLLTAIGGVRTNARIGAVNAAINLPVSIALGARYGTAGVAAGTIVGYLAVTPWLMHAAERQLRALESDDA